MIEDVDFVFVDNSGRAERHPAILRGDSFITIPDVVRPKCIKVELSGVVVVVMKDEDLVFVEHSTWTTEQGRDTICAASPLPISIP